jgi:hypothetical protein
MQSIVEKFTELRRQLKSGIAATRQTGFDPVYYLVFPASEILQAKRELPRILAQLKLDGYTPHVFSLTDVLNNWFQEHSRRPLWQKGLESSGQDRELFRKQFSSVLESSEVLSEKVREKIDEIGGDPQAILILTDLESLHPFLHISGVEQQLVGKFKVPTIVLYPGVRGGAYSLRFLGIHQENANYRSIHIG